MSAMFDSPRLPAKLWPHQRQAVLTINGYLQSGGNHGRSALITMPTGTGKSGVIACAVTLLPGLAGHRLVLTPWDALVRQLIGDIEQRFWSQAGTALPKPLPVVTRLPPSGRIEEILEAAQPTVYVATIAAVQTLVARRGDLASLFEAFDVVLVDEGHYEPAHRWSRAIRELDRPTVLLSATPYRNDEKFFLIGDWRFRFTHHEAVQRRFLRTPGRTADAVALVVGAGDRDPERTWDAYLEFDGQQELQAVASVPQLANRIIEAQPSAFYYDRAYRTMLDLDDSQGWRTFAFPLRARVFWAPAGGTMPSLTQIAGAIGEEWYEKDRVVFGAQQPDRDTVVVPYIVAENSALLRSAAFIETSFGYTVASIRRQLLFLYDARGSVPQLVRDRLLPVPPGELSALFAEGASSLTTVALSNTDIGRHAPRTRQTRAAAIDDLGPDLTDFAYVCTTAEGHCEVESEPFRRYLGLSRSRVVDHRPGERDFQTFSAWLDELAGALRDRARRATTTFSRYAREVPPPEDPEPVHVLLDVDVAEFVRHTDTGEVPLRLQDTAYAVTDGTFEIIANDDVYPASLTWEATPGRYQLCSPALSANAFHERDGDGRELLSAINQTQALRIVPASTRSIYSHGSFYEPVIPVRRRGGFRLLDVLVPVPELATVTSEKGIATQQNDWDQASVFGLISALGPGPRAAPPALSGLLPSLDLLLCTDMGTELADFMATTPRRVVFMHAQAPQTTWGAVCQLGARLRIFCSP